MPGEGGAGLQEEEGGTESESDLSLGDGASSGGDSTSASWTPGVLQDEVSLENQDNLLETVLLQSGDIGQRRHSAL